LSGPVEGTLDLTRTDGVGGATARAVCAALLLALAACGGGDKAAGEKGGEKGGQQKGGPGGPGGGPTEVGFVVVQPTTSPVVAQLAARVVAYQSSEVRPQVTGVIQRRFFTEGAVVQRGQPLYQIDPSLYRAQVNQAAANVQSALANQEAARVRADRFRPLAEAEAVSRQDYTDALATARQATAAVAQTRAALELARTNLRFATVPAPITGRIGRSLLTVGALASATQTEPLATIQQLDPIFVDMQQSASELLALRRALSTRQGVTPTRAEVRLQLEDGSDFGQVGTVEFSEVVVDQSTGTVTLRARFPNPNNLLLPGLFVQARFAQALNTRAFLVPQPAINRDPQGRATLFVVGAGNKAEQRNVTADRAVGQNWVVTAGLKPGERVIVQGLADLRPGQPLRPVAANTPQRVQPPSPEQMKARQQNGGGAGGSGAGKSGGGG
jgi:membrane fusion protein (multidrug efflux system)